MAKRYELPDTARELIADMVSPPRAENGATSQ